MAEKHFKYVILGGGVAAVRSEPQSIDFSLSFWNDLSVSLSLWSSFRSFLILDFVYRLDFSVLIFWFLKWCVCLFWSVETSVPRVDLIRFVWYQIRLLCYFLVFFFLNGEISLCWCCDLWSGAFARLICGKKISSRANLIRFFGVRSDFFFFFFSYRFLDEKWSDDDVSQYGVYGRGVSPFRDRISSYHVDPSI